jgi:hypothetical protein
MISGMLDLVRSWCRDGRIADLYSACSSILGRLIDNYLRSTLTGGLVWMSPVFVLQPAFARSGYNGTAAAGVKAARPETEIGTGIGTYR